jgi:hypothetical protein
MAEANETTTTTETTQTEVSESATGEETKDWAAEATKWRELARKHEDRAKSNANAAKELEQLRQSAMSDQEKAVAQARTEGHAEGLAAGMARVVKAEIRAAAAGRMSAEQLGALLEATNLAVFIGEDGDVDEAKVARFVDGIAPMPSEEETRPGFPDLGQGARGGSSNQALNGDPLLRDLKAKLGVR